MIKDLNTQCCPLRGGHLVATSLSIGSVIAIIGAAGLFAPAGVSAQTAVVLDCLPGSTGPTVDDPAPYGGGICDLGSLRANNLGFSAAEFVSADGVVIVGQAETGDNTSRAFRWIDDGTGMLDLGSLRADNLGRSAAYVFSAGGAVIAGSAATDDNNNRAFRWIDDGTGMLDLGSLRADNLGYSEALGISADGAVIVGYAETDDNTFRAFIWRTQMQDFENLMLSFPVLANESAVAQTEQQFALGQVMSQGGFAAAGQTFVSARVGSQMTDRNPTTIGARTTSLAALTFGRGISDTFTLGATISLSGTSLKNIAFDMGTGFGAAIWGQYSAGGVARTGLQFSGALGYMRAEGKVARGRVLTGVLLATGASTVQTRAMEASLGYGFEQGNWLVTPSLGVAHYETIRAAYTESTAAFNASYDAMRTSRTVATLGVTGEFVLGEQGRLSLGVGVDHDVNPERPRLTGTSDIPGLATFEIGSTFNPNRTRAFATVGYTHDFGNGSTVSGDLRVGQAVYGTTPSVGLGVTYRMRF